MSREADEYEEKFMAGEGEVLYRSKFRSPWYITALFLGSGALAAAGALAGGSVLAALLAGGVMSFMWVNFAALRVTVSENNLHVQFGLFGPKVPVTSITHVEAKKYNWLKYGGKGIRFGLDGSTAYNMIGDKSEGVEVHYRTARGKLKKILVASDDPQKLAAAIEDARARATATALGTDSSLAEAKQGVGLLDAPEASALELVPAADEGADENADDLEALQNVNKTAEVKG